MSLYAQKMLNAIPDLGETEFQKVKNPKKDAKGEVEIYSPAEISKLLATAITHDIDLIPGLVFGCFEGLRPDEFHAENAKRKKLTWEAINWQDQRLHVMGQKVRSKATRDIPLHSVAEAWLTPFKALTGAIWGYTKAYDDKMRTLCAKAGLDRRYDAFRHSYASYRIRHLKGDLSQLANEMGNSPVELINSYKRNVTDKEADAWFAVMPPDDYCKAIRTVLASRQTA
jgi:integrase